MSAARQVVESWIEGADESMRPALEQLCALITEDLNAVEASTLRAVAEALDCEAETFATIVAARDLRTMATARAELIADACRRLRLDCGRQVTPDDMDIEAAVELARDAIRIGVGASDALRRIATDIETVHRSAQRDVHFRSRAATCEDASPDHTNPGRPAPGIVRVTYQPEPAAPNPSGDPIGGSSVLTVDAAA